MKGCVFIVFFSILENGLNILLSFVQSFDLFNTNSTRKHSFINEGRIDLEMICFASISSVNFGFYHNQVIKYFSSVAAN